MYRVQYAAGDPGIFSTIGNIARGAVNVVGRVAAATPAGRAITAIRDVVSGGGTSSNPRAATPQPPGPQMSISPGSGAVTRTAPGGQTVSVGVSPLGTLGVAVRGGRTRGTHLNRSSYHLRDGTFVPAGTREVPNRSMNPCNPRALKKGLRRAHRFAHIARAVIGFSSPKPPKGRLYFKRRAKR